MIIRDAQRDDMAELLQLQKTAFISEAELYENFNIQPLIQTLDELIMEYEDSNKYFIVLMKENRIIGSVRAEIKDDICFIQKLIVHPDYQKKGYGKMLMNEIETKFKKYKKFQLFTGEKSDHNIRFYSKLGYRVVGKRKYIDDIHMVFMEKEN